MVTIKSYTDISQSKVLAKILPIESVDMYYLYGDEADMQFGSGCYEEIEYWSKGKPRPVDIPCWSLAALLEYLAANFNADIKYLDNYWELDCRVIASYNKNLVDACVAVIEKLHEQKFL